MKESIRGIIRDYPELEQRELSVIKWFRWAGYNSPLEHCPMAFDHGNQFVKETLIKFKRLGIK